MSLIYKIATEPSEFEQIVAMNYRTFVEEIPQHNENERRILIDKFHEENTYIICLKDEKLIGMICVRSNRPFSLDGKIGRVEDHLPVSVQNPCEIRLLSVDPNYRNGRVFLGLAQALIRYCLKIGYDAAVISGTTRQLKLYGQLGFQPFAYMTGNEEAAFQPMYLTKATFDEGVAGRILNEPVNFLPGPVTITNEVREAFMKSPISHRSVEFESILERVQARLTKLTNSRYVQVLHGTGTLANDVIAAQLSLLNGKGLILVNGEFGKRLVDHAQRMGLDFDTLETDWGNSFKKEEITTSLSAAPYEWVWAVHCETSTGIKNDIELLKELCQERNIHLCLDCISSLGAIHIDLDGVAFASGVSGKALASYTGLSFVFHNAPIASDKRIPRYLDIGAYMEAEGIPYSQSSNLVNALEKALERYDDANKVYGEIEARYELLRSGIEDAGLSVLASNEDAAPTILTVEMPSGFVARNLGDDLSLNGFNLHYESSYLQEKNWLQISCINHIDDRQIKKMLKVLKGICTIKQLSIHS